MTRRHRLFVVSTIAVAAAALVSPGFAQGSPAPSAPPVAPASGPAPARSLADSLAGQAKADYEAGKLLYRNGDYAGALIKFQTAFAESKDPRLLWNAAACEKSQRHYAQSLVLVKQYLAAGGALLSEQDRSDATEMVRALEPFSANVIVKVNEPGASIYVDDRLVGESPFVEPLLLDIGSRRIRVTKPGYKEYANSVVIAGAGTLTIEARIERDVHEGRLLVRAGAGDAIAIDGSVVATGQFEGVLPSGPHTLRVSASGKRTQQSDVVVVDNQLRAIDVNLESESRGVPLWLAVVGTAVVAGGLGVGGYFLFKPTEKTTNPPSGTLGTAQLASFR